MLIAVTVLLKLRGHSLILSNFNVNCIKILFYDVCSVQTEPFLAIKLPSLYCILDKKLILIPLLYLLNISTVYYKATILILPWVIFNIPLLLC